jgi:hypothetical protein
MAFSLKNELRKTLETMRMTEKEQNALHGGDSSESFCWECTQRAQCKYLCTYCVGLCKETSCSICMWGSAC